MNESAGRIRLTTAALLCAAISAAASAQTTKPDPPDDADSSKVAYVKMETSKGDFILELNREKAPITTENFLSYVEDEFYDGTIFHRVMSTFMIQGGGFDKDTEKKKTKDPIKNEWKNGLKNKLGTISMARTQVHDSATSQFFINVVDNAMLDKPSDGAAYAVFGKVVAGMKTIDAIKDVKVTRGRMSANEPVETIVIEKAREITAEDAKKAIAAEKEAESDDDGSRG